RIVATSGVATATDRLTRKNAPKNAPSAPGSARIATVRQSTLPIFAWETPEARVVPSWAKLTAADAEAGAMPTATSIEVDVTPYPMPREPSTSWATKPNTASRTSRNMGGTPVGRLARATARGRAGDRRPHSVGRLDHYTKS